MTLVQSSRSASALPALLVCAALLSACESTGDWLEQEALDYEPVQFQVEGKELLASGVIDASTLVRFREVVAAHEGLERLVLLWVPGSADDEANLELARRVRALGLATEVPPGGLVASGGTDLFLAGRERYLAPEACVGVHSWGDGDGLEGADLPRNHPDHEPYLRYYEDIGIDPAFYWFTLEAAGADSIHWMSPGEQNRFGMTTSDEHAQNGRTWPGQSACDERLPE